MPPGRTVRDLSRCGSAPRRWLEGSERLRDWLVRDAEVKHLDETGFRIARRTQWLLGLGTEEWTFYHTHPRRGSVLGGLQGCLVHNHWKSYFTALNVRPQLCNAPHLRELQALLDLDREVWAAGCSGCCGGRTWRCA